MRWILFQTGIFDEDILKYDVSTITTAFNCPHQYIFLNVTVKEDLAQLVVEVITSNKVQPNRNYVVGGFIAHTFLGHAYQVANSGKDHFIFNIKCIRYNFSNLNCINERSEIES